MRTSVTRSGRALKGYKNHLDMVYLAASGPHPVVVTFFPTWTGLLWAPSWPHLELLTLILTGPHPDLVTLVLTSGQL